MDKTAIKNFAVAARRILMESAIEQAGLYGISKDKIREPLQKGPDFELYETIAGSENRIFGTDIKKRANLVKAINEQGFDQVIEETAFTWFNRIIAIRFMEVNNYLPTKVRVLSSEVGSSTPDIVAQSSTVDLNLSLVEQEKIQSAKNENNFDEAFRFLFIKQCNELNKILPGLFETIDDYMELLLKIPYTSDGVVRLLVDTIPETNFDVENEGQVEIIGWLYQYYNSELKDDTFAKLKNNIKITKERIPAATQLFTPDWIVRYMVENSVGRIWIEHLLAINPAIDEKEKAEEFGWKYYLPEAEQEDNVRAQLVEIRKPYKNLTPQDITCIDPCMGSGHILVYMFDVLMDIYRSEGFSEREAVFDILEKNIRGLDIDRRAYQLSYFALMMKARGYNRIFFRGHEDIDGNRVQAVPRVYAIEESNPIDRSQLNYFGAGLDELSKNNAINQLNGLLDSFLDAKEYGSILTIEKYDWVLLKSFLEAVSEEEQGSLFAYMAYQSRDKLKVLVEIGEVLAEKYAAVVTNPPYMSARGSMSPVLTKYLSKNYPVSKNDLFTVFMEVCQKMSRYGGLFSMVNQQSWMFLAGFEKLRNQIYSSLTIENMLHIGTGAFEGIAGEVVQSVAFAMRNVNEKRFKATYLNLTNARWKNYLNHSEAGYKTYNISIEEIEKIPNGILCYHLGGAAIEQYYNGKRIDKYADPRVGMATGDNDLFVRLWFEVAFNNVGLGVKSGEDTLNRSERWYPYNKGGECRRWYGNRTHLVDWFHNGKNITDFKQGRLLRGEIEKKNSECWNREYYFMESISWSKVSSGRFATRYYEPGFIFDVAGCSILGLNENIYYVMGALNSELRNAYIESLSPTLNFETGAIKAFPIIEDSAKKELVSSCVKKCISLEKQDWDAFETSWDFEVHPLVKVISEHEAEFDSKDNIDLAQCFDLWRADCDKRFEELKQTEEEINRIFIDIYKLNNELQSEVKEEDVTVRKADLGRDIRSLISYAVGCMMGRYSIAEKGLIYAGGDFDKGRYGKFGVDKDAIIPLTDEAYFDDDIVARFTEFIKVVFGPETLEDNLNFIADALGTKGTSAKEKIRNYFLNDFYKDHCNMYSVTGSGKRPIYWLFDSGKQNGFKALIYMHRYTPDTVGLIRSDYLSKIQSSIENALKNAEYTIQTTSSAVDKAQAMKKQDKYIKQLAEIKAYYPALSHIALQKIAIDLDDGVKVNYAKFQGIEVIDENGKKQKVDLLAKI